MSNFAIKIGKIIFTPNYTFQKPKITPIEN